MVSIITGPEEPVQQLNGHTPEEQAALDVAPKEDTEKLAVQLARLMDDYQRACVALNQFIKNNPRFVVRMNHVLKCPDIQHAAGWLPQPGTESAE